MNIRVAFIVLVFGFIALLLVMGVAGFVRWVRIRYPGRASLILAAVGVVVVGSALAIAMELRERPTFRLNDLVTLHEPLVATTLPSGRTLPTETCVIDRYEHVGVVDIDGGTLTVRVESNKASSPVFCPIGIDVRTEIGWLHDFTVTRR